MKFFAPLVGILVLFLSTMPCCTGEDTCNEPEGSRLEASSTAGDFDPESPCSPFLSCGSCVGFSQERQAEPTFALPVISFKAKAVFCALCQPTGYCFSLIKPPAVALA